MERANVKKHEGLLTKKSYLSTWSGIVSMGAGKIWGRREGGSVRIDTRKNRFHEQRVFLLLLPPSKM